MKKVLKVRIKDNGKVIFENLPEALDFLKDLQLAPTSEVLAEDKPSEEEFEKLKDCDQ